MAPTTLADLLVQELKNLYDAERRLVVALPRLARAANDPEIRLGFIHHLRQTRRQSERLERAMLLLGQTPRRRTCEVMRTLLASTHRAVGLHAVPAVKDAALIAVAQRIKHYEIAGYGIARIFAELLDQPDVVRLLQDNLDEETEAAQRLGILAETIELRAPAARSNTADIQPRADATEPGR